DVHVDGSAAAGTGVEDEEVALLGVAVQRVREAPGLIGRQGLGAAFQIPRADHGDVSAGVEACFHADVNLRPAPVWDTSPKCPDGFRLTDPKSRDTRLM